MTTVTPVTPLSQVRAGRISAALTDGLSRGQCKPV